MSFRTSVSLGYAAPISTSLDISWSVGVVKQPQLSVERRLNYAEFNMDLGLV